MSQIVISDRRIAVNGNRYRVSFAVTGTGVDELWFDVPVEYSDWVSESFDAAVVGLLLPAMVAGKDICVQGSLSIRLAWFLTRTVMPIMTVVQKGTVPIEITGFTPVGAAGRIANAVALGLSTGIDSTIAVNDYGPGSAAPADLKITHLIFNDVGAAGRFDNENSSEVSIRRRENVNAAARTLGVPLINTWSNVDSHQGDLVHSENHIFKNATTSLLLQRGIRSFHYAADLPWRSMKVLDNLSYVDPMLLPDLSTENVTLRSISAEYDRLTKTVMISNLPFAQQHLDICERSYPNCSTCKKCLPTMMILESVGALEKFDRRFDKQKYLRLKTRWAAWGRNGYLDQGAIAAKMFRPTGFTEAVTFYALLFLQRFDRWMRVIPGYNRLAAKSLQGRIRRHLLYRI